MYMHKLLSILLHGNNNMSGAETQFAATSNSYISNYWSTPNSPTYLLLNKIINTSQYLNDSLIIIKKVRIKL